VTSTEGETGVQWSVSAQAAGDRELTREEIVELADAVAPAGGVASGIGQTAYGAQVLVEADTREAALERGARIFTAAAARAGLPAWPISAITALSEDEDELDGQP
jgi:hypothetical protein